MVSRFPLRIAVAALIIAGCASSRRGEKDAATLAASDSLPIACTLTPEQLSSRRDQLLPGLLQRAVEVTDLEHGVRMSFESSEGLLAELANVIEQERTCCSFLRFQLAVEPGSGPILLDVTGPPGTRELLQSILIPDTQRPSSGLRLVP